MTVGRALAEAVGATADKDRLDLTCSLLREFSTLLLSSGLRERRER